MGISVSPSLRVPTRFFNAVIVVACDCRLDCRLIALPGDLPSRTDGQTISRCVAYEARISVVDGEGKKKCVLGAPTIVPQSAGFSHSITRDDSSRMYITTERAGVRPGNERLQRAIPRNGMEWNGMERNSRSVLQNISFHRIAATILHRETRRATHKSSSSSSSTMCRRAADACRPHHHYHPWPANTAGGIIRGLIIVPSNITLSFVLSCEC